jgi:hypothetical protein
MLILESINISVEISELKQFKGFVWFYDMLQDQANKNVVVIIMGQNV